jgi:hypothetical protein
MTQKSAPRTDPGSRKAPEANSLHFPLMEDPVSAPASDDPRAILRGGLPDRYLTADDIAVIFKVPKETVYQ